ncbi:hypothetical protein QWY14_02295 [Planococcus sp. N028]|uniref:DUF3221 domain-containing protein n=1 Tax=Planococcus shixiaomingii TaxID=3058393 RepID=A0ABT8MY87_9BACL|nr:hypothetical protein [Planococcus sp. N028]MDN7240598.1 hypothetical protein [Planococcus sp. N028]
MLMKSFAMLLFTVFLFGCNTQNSSDYQGYIEEVKETSIVISPPATDPEADYPVYEIFVGEDTLIEGSRNSFDELKRLDGVKVWIDNESEEKEFAERIVVED